MNIRHWIDTLRLSPFGCPVRGRKLTPNGIRCRPVLERLEDRLAPAAGLTSGKEQLLSAYGQLPLSFEANQGQTDAQVKFLTQGSGYSMFLTASGAVMSLAKPDAATTDGATGVALALNLVGANPAATAAGLDALPGTSNYFIGNDPSQWHAGIANYSKVEYQNVYPGINLVYYGNQQRLEYDYQVAPGADPSDIQFTVQGADSVALDDQGNLVLHTAIGDAVQNAPVIYQIVGGVQQPVAGRFVLGDQGSVRFQVGTYDASLPLTIDPVLSYSTLLHGSDPVYNLDYGYGIAVDNSGDAYVTGKTLCTTFPTTVGAFHTSHASDSSIGYNAYDAFVTKLNASGTGLIYSTFLGANGDDIGQGIAVDSSGNAYIVGTTTSTNFPTTAGAHSIQPCQRRRHLGRLRNQVKRQWHRPSLQHLHGGQWLRRGLWNRRGRLGQCLRHRIHLFHQFSHHRRRLSNQPCHRRRRLGRLRNEGERHRNQFDLQHLPRRQQPGFSPGNRGGRLRKRLRHRYHGFRQLSHDGRRISI